MATICETIEETLSQDKCKPNCPCKKLPLCPPGCSCKEDNKQTAALRLVFNALGILVALLATYMIITTDSKLYLVFWICYSVLRRMMLKTKSGARVETAIAKYNKKIA
ncbi:unnamed protein product [Parnassius apollo]|uniref:(apollo) hypothetical protein n=1 Tax=Parnassius apollo TaxID=110799 RepID=A0A8S3W2Y4_PARAO|nr:unnamed protein product [Parnassius apollo]